MDDPVNVMRRSPAEREKEKTRAERSEDVAYTINHAVSCGTTDMFIAPTISALFGVHVGCSDPTHHHGKHGEEPKNSAQLHSHDHHSHTNEHSALPPTHAHDGCPSMKKFNRKNLSWKMYREEAWHYLRGEVIGDVLAVPLTIGVQRFFPSMMEGIGRLIEPIAGPFFHRGATQAAKKWAAQKGFAEDSSQVVDRAKAIYRTEIKHLPQVVVWNLFAFPIGALTQKMSHHADLKRILYNKSMGALISNGLLLGGRAVAPDTAERWDDFNSRHVIQPATKMIGRVFGVRDEDMHRLERNEPAVSWTQRMEKNAQDNRQMNALP